MLDSAKKLQARRNNVREGKIKRRGRRKLLQEIMEGNSDLLTLFSCWRYNYLASGKKGWRNSDSYKYYEIPNF